MSSGPTCVALYAWKPPDRVRAAEFRWSPDSGVTLTILDPDWADIAREYYEDGVVLHLERRVVHQNEGAAFMRALLGPSNSSYYAFVDESDRA